MMGRILGQKRLCLPVSLCMDSGAGLSHLCSHLRLLGFHRDNQLPAIKYPWMTIEAYHDVSQSTQRRNEEFGVAKDR